MKKIFDFCHFLLYNCNVVILLLLGRSDEKMFKVGDKIVYPMHGAGVIETIEERAILDEKQSYYIIKMPGEVKVMVPTSKAEEIGVRNIIDKETAGKVINVLEQDSTEMSLKWNKRYRDNVERMKSGDIFEVADIVRNLTFKQKEKGLSTTEKKMLVNAKQILVSELVLAESKDKDEVEELVNDKINTSFQMHELSATENLQKAVGMEEDNSNIVKKFIPAN
jgi:CarD family transcriptional regulator